MITVALMRHGGSHLIRPIVHGMTGAQLLEPGKKGRPIDRAEGPVIVFLREPRDRMVATFRWWSKKEGKAARLAAAGKSVDRQMAWLLSDAGFMADMLRWSKIWCSWPGALTVRFEDIRANGPSEVERIATFLGVKCDADELFGQVYKNSPTYTGRHSDWREWFGPRSLAAWDANGGQELLRVMDYD